MKNGFTFIEVIMAAVLLSLVAVPVLNGFYISGKNFQYAYDHYRAGLEAQSVLEQARRFLCDTASRLSEAEGFFDIIDGDGLDAGYFEYVLRLHEITGPSSMSDKTYEFVSNSGLITEGHEAGEALSINIPEGIAFQKNDFRPEDDYQTVLAYDGSFTSLKDELSIFNEDSLNLTGRTGYHKVLIKISETDEEAVLRLLSGEGAYVWLDLLYPSGWPATFELDASLFKGRYFLYECENYNMKRYLTTAVIYDKSGRRMAGMEKIIYAAE